MKLGTDWSEIGEIWCVNSWRSYIRLYLSQENSISLFYCFQNIILTSLALPTLWEIYFIFSFLSITVWLSAKFLENIYFILMDLLHCRDVSQVRVTITYSCYLGCSHQFPCVSKEFSQDHGDLCLQPQPRQSILQEF